MFVFKCFIFVVGVKLSMRALIGEISSLSLNDDSSLWKSKLNDEEASWACEIELNEEFLAISFLNFSTEVL
jgi:hypothetical protein